MLFRSGSEIVVTISPSPEQIIAQTLDMVSFDAEPRSEHELVQRAAELSSALQQYGLEVGKMCAMPNNYYELNSDQVNAYSIHETEKKSNYGYR